MGAEHLLHPSYYKTFSNARIKNKQSSPPEHTK